MAQSTRCAVIIALSLLLAPSANAQDSVDGPQTFADVV